METEIDIYEQLDPEIENSFAYDYKEQKALFDWKTIRAEENVSELEITYFLFQELSDRIIVLSKEYFKKVLDNDTEQDLQHYNLSNVYIAEIQNLYLNPINYRLNQLKNRKSLRVAWIIAIVSAVLATFSIFLTWHYGKNPTPCSCCSVEKVQTENIKSIEIKTVENQDSCSNAKIKE